MKGGENNINMILISIIIVNMTLGITNRILQIVNYCINVYYFSEDKRYKNEVKAAALMFCILPTIVSVFMMSLYLIFHNEETYSPIVKIKKFFLFILSIEILYPLGVHQSLSTKYSYNADNPLITMRLINAIHFMFVALPQLLIVPITCSAEEHKFHPVDITSLIFSIIFMIWSIGYYFLCVIYYNHFDDYITEYVEKRKEKLKTINSHNN